MTAIDVPFRPFRIGAMELANRMIGDPAWVEKVRAGDSSALKSFDAAVLSELT